jgi:hypothetical protein
MTGPEAGGAGGELPHFGPEQGPGLSGIEGSIPPLQGQEGEDRTAAFRDPVWVPGMGFVAGCWGVCVPESDPTWT